MKRFLLFGIVLPLTFVGSCFAWLPVAVRLTDPLTHTAVETLSSAPFPVLIVQGENARVLMVEDLRGIPPLPEGATYLVPPGREASFQREINKRVPPERDSFWVLKVERTEADRQRIELYLMGDGYFGGAYDATDLTVTPRYRKVTGFGFAFIFGGCALAMNFALWAVGAFAVRIVRRRLARSSG